MIEYSKNIEIGINILCDVEMEKIELFKIILTEHVSFIGENEISTLKEILIAEDENVASIVNTLIKSVEPSGIYTQRDQRDSWAVTVPIETDGVLKCFIVMGKRYFTYITPEFSHPFNTVSMLLEELLHVKIYTLLWKKRGYIQHINKGFGICKSDLLSVASSMIDEYLVSRMKANILSINNSFQLESGKELIGGKLNYGGNVLNRIKAAELQLKEMVEKLRIESRSIPETWREIIRILYRNIFEPLSRNAPFCDENQEPRNEEQLKSVKIYRELIVEYWENIHDQLKVVYESNLSKYESALNEIYNIIDALFNRIGITYSRVSGEDCWVNIDPKILNLLEN